MVMSLKEAVDLHERNIVGIPLRRGETHDLLAEIAVLRDTLVAKEDHIRTLRNDVSMWQARSMADSRLRAQEVKTSFERERQLVSVIHRQIGEIQTLREEQGSTHRRALFRGRRGR